MEMAIFLTFLTINLAIIPNKMPLFMAIILKSSTTIKGCPPLQ